MPNPSRETKFSGANADREISIFPVQLTTCRIGNLTRLIYTLALCVTIHVEPVGQGAFIFMMSKIYLVAIIGDRDGMDFFSDKLVILIQIILILCNILKCKNDGNGSKPTQHRFRYFFQIFPNFPSKIWK